jgi:hypothetical protein
MVKVGVLFKEKKREREREGYVVGWMSLSNDVREDAAERTNYGGRLELQCIQIHGCLVPFDSFFSDDDGEVMSHHGREEGGLVLFPPSFHNENFTVSHQHHGNDGEKQSCYFFLFFFCDEALQDASNSCNPNPN